MQEEIPEILKSLSRMCILERSYGGEQDPPEELRRKHKAGKNAERTQGKGREKRRKGRENVEKEQRK